MSEQEGVDTEELVVDFLDEVRDTAGVPACLQASGMSTQRLELHALYCTRAAYNKAGGSDAAV